MQPGQDRNRSAWNQRQGLHSVTLLLSILLLPSPVPAARLTPGTVINPVDRPVYQPPSAQVPGISRETGPVPAPAPSSLRIKISRFLFSGNTTFSDAQLANVVKPYEGRKLSLAEIYQVADRVERYYRDHGYLLTSVYVPAQSIRSGSIRLEVIEGRLGEIHLEGRLQSYDRAFLRNQLDGLQPGEILDDATLETETLLLADLPGLDTRVVIRPGRTYGSSDLTFVNQEDRYTGMLSVNNFGRKSIGEYRVEGGFFMANPVSQGDALNLSGIIAQDGLMYYGRLDYDIRVGTRGTRLGLGYSAFRYAVDVSEIGLPAGATLGGGGSNLILRASHPLQRSTHNNTTVLVDGRRSITREDGSLGVTPETTINLLDIILSYDHLYRNYARTAVYLALATNFKSRENRLDTTSQRARLSLDLRHYQPFMRTAFVTARVQAVYSPDPLVDVERFRIGGQGSVRAFPSAEIAGDRGAVVSLDVGVNVPVSARLLLVPRVFADAGRVYRIQPVGVPTSAALAGYGAGISAVIARNHSVDLEVVTPTTGGQSSDRRGPRFWLNYRGIL